MGSYFFLPDDDPENEWGHIPVPEVDMVDAIIKIAKKHGLTITNEMIKKHILSKARNRPLKKKNKKVINLYIDGTNLFAGQNELFGPKRFLPFSRILRDIQRFIQVDRVFFYASYMVASQHALYKSKILASTEAQFYRSVRETPNVTFYRGHRSLSSGKEKGVDVHLAVDVVKDALFGRYDEAVIMTGDSDLIYPLEIVKKLKIPVHALFLPNRFSLELAYKANSAAVLNYLSKFKGFSRKLPNQLRIVSIKKPHL